MKRIEELTIQHFRGVSELSLMACGEINLLVGGNNSGKTSVLEAINFLKNPFSPSNLVSVSRQRLDLSKFNH